VGAGEGLRFAWTSLRSEAISRSISDIWSGGAAAGRVDTMDAVSLSCVWRTVRFRRLADLEMEGREAGRAAAVRGGDCRASWSCCSEGLVERQGRERRKSFGCKLARRGGWGAVEGEATVVDDEADGANACSLPTSTMAPGWLVMLIVKWF
jgi:hypothetical protein